MQVFIKRPFLIQESGLNRTTNQAQYLIYVEIQTSWPDLWFSQKDVLLKQIS
jgi:hypothetical protein